MFYCETCQTTDRSRCRCQRIDGENDGDLAEAGPIRYRTHINERINNIFEMSRMPEDDQEREQYLRQWATSLIAGKNLFGLGGRDENNHLIEAVRICEAAEVIATYVESGSSEATKVMLALCKTPESATVSTP